MDSTLLIRRPIRHRKPPRRDHLRRVLTYRVSLLNAASAVMFAVAAGLFVGLVTAP